jgi:hypothetical protein
MRLFYVFRAIQSIDGKAFNERKPPKFPKLRNPHEPKLGFKKRAPGAIGAIVLILIIVAFFMLIWGPFLTSLKGKI